MRNKTHERWIEDWVKEAYDLHSKLTGCPISLPIPIVDVAEQLFGLRCDFAEFRDSTADLAGVLSPEARRILINSDGSPGRHVFTIAHEIAHWIVDCNMGGDGGDLSWITRVRPLNPFYQESTANYLAAALLMPRYLIEPRLVQRSHINAEAIRQFCIEWGISAESLEWRILGIQSGLAPMTISVEWEKTRREENNSDYSVLGAAFQSSSDNMFSKIGCAHIGFVKTDHVLVVGRFDLLDSRIIRQLHEMKQKVSCLYVAAFDEPENILPAAELLEVDKAFLFLSHINLDAQIHELSQKLNCALKVVRLNHQRWLRWACSQFVRSEAATVIEIDRTHKIHYTRQPKRRKSTINGSIAQYLMAVPAPRLNGRRDAARYIRLRQHEGLTVVVATGCYDILTAAHVHFLEHAKDAGDILVVGVEDDNRITAFKGMLRPANSVGERVEVLKALKCVDYVFVISGRTSIDLKSFYTRLYRTLKPDVLAVSEADPAMGARRDEIEAAGGKLQVVQPYEPGISTTSIFKRLVLQHTGKSQVLFAEPQDLQKTNTKATKNEVEQAGTNPQSRKLIQTQLILPLFL
jgi:D-glycero-beta-D-manno-heptose 1-phosphate adenylyltransferase